MTMSNGDGVGEMKPGGCKGASGRETRDSRGRLKVVRHHNGVEQGWCGLNEAEGVETSQCRRNKAFGMLFDTLRYQMTCASPKEGPAAEKIQASNEAGGGTLT